MANINDLGFPFTSVAGDRQYSAAEWREYFDALVTGGIVGDIANELEVKPQAVPNKTVYIDTGAIMIKGAMRSLISTINLTLADNTSGNPRIDRIVARINYTDRKIEFVVKQGTPGASPTATALTQNTTAWELSLAQIALADGYSTITASEITDERTDESLCGYFKYKAKPAWYPEGGSVPLDAWMYTNFKNQLSAGEIADIEANPTLMAIILNSNVFKLDVFSKLVTKESGGITINVYESGAGIKLEGYKISLFQSNGTTLIDTYTVNSEGKVYLELAKNTNFVVKPYDTIIGLIPPANLTISVNLGESKSYDFVYTRDAATIAAKNYLISSSSIVSIAPFLPQVMDVSVVGGGGQGGGSLGVGSSSGRSGSGGGGGGYVASQLNKILTSKFSLPAIVGAGGNVATVGKVTGATGGQTSFDGLSANGGFGGLGASEYSPGAGGAGGSGGGGGGTNNTGTPGGAGGADGANGADATHGAGGIGSGSTTKLFGEVGGTLCSTGGNGAGNAGDGASATNSGGGGGGTYCSSSSRAGKAGLNGVIALRWQ